MNSKETLWQKREKERILTTTAYEKVSRNEEDTVTPREAQEFFRVDDYITGKSREEKINRVEKVFSSDQDLNRAIKILAKKRGTDVCEKAVEAFIIIKEYWL